MESPVRPQAPLDRSANRFKVDFLGENGVVMQSFDLWFLLFAFTVKNLAGMRCNGFRLHVPTGEIIDLTPISKITEDLVPEKKSTKVP